MEFLLLWWDELDDVAHACRHLATAAIFEVTAYSAPVAAVTSTLCTWLLLRLHG